MLNENLTYEDEVLESAQNRYQWISNDKCFFTIANQQLLRDTIYNFYVEKKIRPTSSMLLMSILEEIPLPSKFRCLCGPLRRMGYQRKRSKIANSKVIVEKFGSALQRIDYIEAIEDYRKQNRNIVYVDEILVDSSFRSSKCWPLEETLSILESSNSSYRFVIMHAGGKNGFVNDAKLIFKICSTTENFYDEMNYVTFKKWMKEKLMPQIPANSVIVMDNAPYHNVEINKPPTIHNTKEKMVDWLAKHNIPYTQTMSKYELYELILKNKKKCKTFRIDKMLKSHGHDTLRLPMSMCDVNPMELAWTHIQLKLQQNHSSALTYDDLEECTNAAIKEIDQSDWEHFCTHVAKLEKEYWNKEVLMDDATDEMSFELESSDLDTDSDSDVSSICSCDESDTWGESSIYEESSNSDEGNVSDDLQE